MRLRGLLAARRRRVAGATQLEITPRSPLMQPRSRRGVWIALLVALLLSVGIHAGAGAWVSAQEVPERMQRTVIKVVNDDLPDQDPFEELSKLDDLAADEAVEYLEPVMEAFDEPEETASPAEDALAEGGEEFAEGELEEDLSALTDAAPVEEVYGIDFEDSFDHGAAAVRVGNTLKAKAGRFVDPSKVRPLRRQEKIETADAAPQAMDEPEFPDLTPDDLPDLAAAPPPLIEAPPPPSPPPPPKEIVRVVPKKKYRTRVVPDYTDEAIDMEVEGLVVVDVWVSERGEVRKTCIVDGLGYGLDERVEEAARRSTFNPVLADGEPVPCRYRLKYRFQLDV